MACLRSAAIVGLLTVACDHGDSRSTALAPESSRMPDPIELEVVADPNVTAVDGAEPAALAAGEWLRFQMISLAKGCRGNYRFVVRRDGAALLARNQRSDCPPPQRFDTPYPAAPTATLDVATHAGPRLEGDAAAAHAGLMRDADAASAALHSLPNSAQTAKVAGFSEPCGVPWNAVGLTR
jgi:hypothetical protein